MILNGFERYWEVFPTGFLDDVDKSNVTLLCFFLVFEFNSIYSIL